MAGEALVFEHFYLHSGMDNAGLATAINLTGAAGDKSIWNAFHPLQVARVGVIITTAVNYDTLTAADVIAFDRRVTYGSDTGRVEMGRITIPDAAVAGAVYYLDIPNADGKDQGEVRAGGQIVCEVITAGTGGGSIAGAWQPFVTYQPLSTGHPSNNLNGNSVVTLIRDTTTTQV